MGRGRGPDRGGGRQSAVHAVHRFSHPLHQHPAFSALERRKRAPTQVVANQAIPLQTGYLTAAVRKYVQQTHANANSLQRNDAPNMVKISLRRRENAAPQRGFHRIKVPVEAVRRIPIATIRLTPEVTRQSPVPQL